MNNLSIRVQNIGKTYRLNDFRHDTLRDSLASFLSRGFLKRKEKVEKHNLLQAVNKISFDVHEGEVVGIIGRNGAGKSTLLKIISRITEPTYGRVELYGRVGSLLEVGTGFHPELSGRENIYLNGAILGMTRKEIQRKFDEIINFAEIEKFLDTPVKRYSSGMYVRLAFSVAAHLEPEILIVDEVLAVGDASFQRKCLGKMSEVSNQGRTVLFVSHNMAAIQSLCSRGILLNQGTIAVDGSINDAVSYYLQSLQDDGSSDLTSRKDRNGKGQVKLVKIDIIRNDENQTSSVLMTGYPARFVFYVDHYLPGLSCTFTIYDLYGQAVTNFDSSINSPIDMHGNSNHNRLICEIDELPLVTGRYRINVAIRCHMDLDDQDKIEAAAFFDVEQGHFQGRSVRSSAKFGNIAVSHRWIVPD